MKDTCFYRSYSPIFHYANVPSFHVDFLIPSFPKGEPPFAEHVIGMGIRGGEETLDLNSLIDLPDKVCELTPVHLLADEFPQSSSEPCLLGRATGDLYDHLILPLMDLIAHQDMPGEVFQGLDKPPESLFLDMKTANQILRGHSGNPAPHLFVDSFRRLLIELLGDVDEPEGIHHAIMPQQKLDVAPEPFGFHPLEL